MKPFTHLDEALAELRQEHRSIEAPPSLEAHLAEQTHRLRTSHPARLAWIWASGLGFAILAACVAGVAYWRLDHQVPLPKLPRPAPLNASVQPPQPDASSSAPTRTTATKPARRPLSKHNSPATDDSTVEGFLALPSSEGLPAPSAASLVRLRIKTESLRQYGLDVPSPTAPETILAEFVVGEDGLPRAIRILR